VFQTINQSVEESQKEKSEIYGQLQLYYPRCDSDVALLMLA